jgi:hypothetical protein
MLTGGITDRQLGGYPVDRIFLHFICLSPTTPDKWKTRTPGVSYPATACDLDFSSALISFSSSALSKLFVSSGDKSRSFMQ